MYIKQKLILCSNEHSANLPNIYSNGKTIAESSDQPQRKIQYGGITYLSTIYCKLTVSTVINL